MAVHAAAVPNLDHVLAVAEENLNLRHQQERIVPGFFGNRHAPLAQPVNLVVEECLQGLPGDYPARRDEQPAGARELETLLAKLAGRRRSIQPEYGLKAAQRGFRGVAFADHPVRQVSARREDQELLGHQLVVALEIGHHRERRDGPPTPPFGVALEEVQCRDHAFPLAQAGRARFLQLRAKSLVERDDPAGAVSARLGRGPGELLQRHHFPSPRRQSGEPYGFPRLHGLCEADQAGVGIHPRGAGRARFGGVLFRLRREHPRPRAIPNRDAGGQPVFRKELQIASRKGRGRVAHQAVDGRAFE